MFPRSFRLFLLALPLVFVACREAKVASYRVPKEKDPEMTPVAATTADSTPPAVGPFMQAAGAGGGMAATPVATASGPGLGWTAPAHWVAKTASAMRKATYAVPGNGAGADGDFSVTAFPSDVGGELANVNRWRGQVKQEPLTEADLAKAVTRIEQNGLRIAYVDVGGGDGPTARMLGAIVPYTGSTWFFKLGPASSALIAREKPAFEEFLKSLKPAASP